MRSRCPLCDEDVDWYAANCSIAPQRGALAYRVSRGGARRIEAQPEYAGGNRMSADEGLLIGRRIKARRIAAAIGKLGGGVAEDRALSDADLAQWPRDEDAP